LLVVLEPPSAFANGPTIGYDGGSIVPLANPDIQLVTESVDLHAPLTDDYEKGRARCWYLLANRSAQPRSFAMSFLGGWQAGWPGLEFMTSRNFWVSIDGQPVTIRKEPIDHARWEEFAVGLPDSLPVWEVTIPARDSVSVNIDYEIEWSGGSDSITDGRELQYYARPARLWAGALRRATFRLHLGQIVTALLRDRAINRDDSAVRLRIEPPDARWTFDGLEWQRTDWEPDTDFRFGIDWDMPQDPDE
jgi:hypothetical protein